MEDMNITMQRCIVLYNMIVKSYLDSYGSALSLLQHFADAQAIFNNSQKIEWNL